MTMKTSTQHWILAGVLATIATTSTLVVHAVPAAPEPQAATRPATPQRPAPQALGAVTSPKAELGNNIGDDYYLANYTQLMAYWRKLEKESPRLRVVEIGKTAEGRPHLMTIITAPENYKKLDRYKEISA